MALEQGEHIVDASQLAAEDANHDFKLLDRQVLRLEPIVHQLRQRVHGARRADDAIDDVATVAGQLGQAEGGLELLPRLARLAEFQQGLPEIEEIQGHFLLVSGGLEELRDERVVAMHSGDPGAEIAALHRRVGRGFQRASAGCRRPPSVCRSRRGAGRSAR